VASIQHVSRKAFTATDLSAAARSSQPSNDSQGLKKC
jgi:hypothetical protein